MLRPQDKRDLTELMDSLPDGWTGIRSSDLKEIARQLKRIADALVGAERQLDALNAKGAEDETR